MKWPAEIKREAIILIITYDIHVLYWFRNLFFRNINNVNFISNGYIVFIINYLVKRSKKFNAPLSFDYMIDTDGYGHQIRSK